MTVESRHADKHFISALDLRGKQEVVGLVGTTGLKRRVSQSSYPLTLSAHTHSDTVQREIIIATQTITKARNATQTPASERRQIPTKR